MGGAGRGGFGGFTVAGSVGRGGAGNGGFGGIIVAGAAGRGGAGDGGSGGKGGKGDPCDVGCIVDVDDACGDRGVTWVCEGNHEQELFRGRCEELDSMGKLRYCCPPEFLEECQ
jgi:hypothetical protein